LPDSNLASLLDEFVGTYIGGNDDEGVEQAESQVQTAHSADILGELLQQRASRRGIASLLGHGDAKCVCL
jgi:hypothetical protein